MTPVRRALLATAYALSLAAGLAPLRALAQGSMARRRLGMLLPNSGEIAQRNPRIQAFLMGLRSFGWIDGQNLGIEWKFAAGDLSRLGELAEELVRQQVDVIVTAASPSAMAAHRATKSIPIVMLDPGDPIALGLIASLARPGGNVTGVTSIAPELAAKRLSLLKEAAPDLSRVAVLSNAQVPPAELAMDETYAAAISLGVRVLSIPIRGVTGMESAFELVLRERCNGMLVFPDPLTLNNREPIIEHAARHRLPTLYGAKDFVEVGGLMSYGPSYRGMFRRGAYFVDRIFRGAKPSDLPVEQPTQFELVVNLKTARAMGLSLPQSFLLRADEIIES